MKLEIADIATNEKKLLKGFKAFGLFPFYLRYINVGTHIKLCRIRELIHRAANGEPKVSDFYDSKLQEAITPLILQYISTALVNGRPFSKIFKYMIDRKLKRCGHYHLLNLFFTIYKLDEPAFFLTYWKLIKKEGSTLLKAETQS